jgi:hypothetical protein
MGFASGGENELKFKFGFQFKFSYSLYSLVIQYFLIYIETIFVIRFQKNQYSTQKLIKKKPNNRSIIWHFFEYTFTLK